MSDTVQNITDRELASKLKSSYISDAQKAQLEALIPKMDEAEKSELLSLIDRSHEEYKKASKTYSEDLDNMGKEFKQKLKDEDKNFRKDLEVIEVSETTESLRNIQAEVSSINALSSKPAARSSGGHGFRNLILGFLLLALIAGGALYMLNTLQ